MTKFCLNRFVILSFQKRLRYRSEIWFTYSVTSILSWKKFTIIVGTRVSSGGFFFLNSKILEILIKQMYFFIFKRNKILIWNLICSYIQLLPSYGKIHRILLINCQLKKSRKNRYQYVHLKLLLYRISILWLTDFVSSVILTTIITCSRINSSNWKKKRDVRGC